MRGSNGVKRLSSVFVLSMFALSVSGTVIMLMGASVYVRGRVP
jgi:hypothetical protein